MTTTNDRFVNKGDEVFSTETPLDTAYFVLEGRVELELSIHDKKVRLEIGPNQFLGDAGVVVGKKATSEGIKYAARAIALENVRLAPVSISEIKAELDNCPPLLKAWFTSFVSRVLVITEQLAVSEYSQA